VKLPAAIIETSGLSSRVLRYEVFILANSMSLAAIIETSGLSSRVLRYEVFILANSMSLAAIIETSGLSSRRLRGIPANSMSDMDPTHGQER
jgi:hypothetical protein